MRGNTRYPNHGDNGIPMGVNPSNAGGGGAFPTTLAPDREPALLRPTPGPHHD